jgi:hypothetical protein
MCRWLDREHLIAISNGRIGDVLLAQGQLADALSAYRRKHQAISALVEQNPGNAEWQRYLIVSHVKLAEIAQRDERTAAEVHRHYVKALAIARDLQVSNRLAPTDGSIIAELEVRLARLAPPTAE